ncbi:MAG: hypothetical protein PHR73_01830 [Candidatus Omnitrophica bacterium]|nr:hypothetical protein [Candidatus Omnitrophota bacterium]MDD5505479.1 hypothetical protein [Candidatus Omnitrophota bacterium]
MMFLKHKIFCLVFPVMILVSGCATTPVEHILDLSANQLKLRSIQTRSFDTSDKGKMMRSVIATMQDLEFVVNKADDELGIITGTKFVGSQILKMTVIVRSKNDKQLLVRANAQFGIKSVDTPEPYQDFFDALSKAVFLTAQNID